MENPSTRIQGVAMLFNLKGLYDYTTLKYLWLAESDPNVRLEILKGFKKIGDHIYIADPDFPKYWIIGLKQYDQQERNKRLMELRRYFPKEVTRYLDGKS